MKTITQRLEALEKATTKDLYGFVSFTDGTTARLSMREVIVAWQNRDSGEKRITKIKWIDNSGDNGILPEIIAYMIERQDETEDSEHK